MPRTWSPPGTARSWPRPCRPSARRLNMIGTQECKHSLFSTCLHIYVCRFCTPFCLHVFFIPTCCSSLPPPPCQLFFLTHLCVSLIRYLLNEGSACTVQHIYKRFQHIRHYLPKFCNCLNSLLCCFFSGLYLKACSEISIKKSLRSCVLM